MKFPINPLKYRYHWLRRPIVHTLVLILFFLSPVVDLFRVDVLSQKVFFSFSAYPMNPSSLFWVITPFYTGVIIIAITSFLFGRLFCGWSCPHNALTELFAPVRNQILNPFMAEQKQAFKIIIALLLVLIMVGISFVLSGLLAAYIVPWQWVLNGYLSGMPHPALVSGQILFSLIGLFLFFAGHDFCRYACPYGMAQGVSAYQEGSKFRPMEIAYQGQSVEEDCGSCKACRQVCPVEIDPRRAPYKVGEFFGCFNCGECIDACKVVFSKRPQLKSLLKFEYLWQHKAS